MSVYNRRKIIGVAVDHSKEDAGDYREDLVSSLHQLLDVTGIKPKEINKALDKSDNWFTNNIRDDQSGHDFSLTAYCRVRMFLEIATVYMWKNGTIDDSDIQVLIENNVLEEEIFDDHEETDN